MVVNTVGGTATAGSGYAAIVSRTVTFPVGAGSGATQVVELKLLTDRPAANDPTETVQLALSSPSALVRVSGTNGTHSVTITDHGDNPSVSLLVAAGDTPAAVTSDGLGFYYVARATTGDILQLDATGTATGVALTGLSSPQGLASDGAGHVFFTEYGASRVSRWTPPLVPPDPSAEIVTIDATSLLNPVGVTVDPGGNVYVADMGHHKIQKYAFTAPSTYAAAVTVAGTGVGGQDWFNGILATSCRLSWPQSVAIGQNGDDLLIADHDNNRIELVDSGGYATIPDIFESPSRAVVADRFGSSYSLLQTGGNNGAVVLRPLDQTIVSTTTSVLGLAYDNGTLLVPSWNDGNAYWLENVELLEVRTTSLPSGTVGVPYSQKLGWSGGSGRLSAVGAWAVTGSLPPGVSPSFDTGVIAGLDPTTAGTYYFTITVAEMKGQAASRALSITIAPQSARRGP